MAATKREVTLGVGIETSGEQGLRSLAADVRGIGDAAGQSTPEIDRLTTELDQLAAATKARRDVEAGARSDAAAARTALNDQRDALARLRAETTAASRSSAEFEAAERGLKLAVIDARIAVRDKTTAAAAAATQTRASVAAERAAEVQLQRVAAQYRASAAAAAASAASQVSGNTAVATSIASIKGQLDVLRNLALAATGGTLIGSLAADVSKTADAYANLRSRISLVTGEGPALAAAFSGVFEVAQRTNSSLENTGTLFARILTAGKELGLAQQDALLLTQTINQAVQVSGASAQASDAAITQLIQGLQSGVLRGDEFNSVMEQAPRLAQAMADGLGVTRGELRKLAEQGTLTSTAVIESLRGQSEAIAGEFERLPLTVGRAITSLSNAWTLYVGEAAKAGGQTSLAASAIQALAGNLDTLATVLYGAGKAAVAFQAINIARAFFETAAATTAATAATTANTAATATNTTAAVANAAARRASAAATVAESEATAVATAGAGRFAAMLGTIKLLTFVGVVTNLRDIGTAIGEGTARFFGYGKAIEAAERAMKADEEAARANAASKAALTQQLRLAEERALDLSDAARRLVAEFDGLRTKGDSAAEALGKLTKNLELSNTDGIRAAGAALDALALKGKISSEQVREALSAALKGEDLLIFETRAREAFDGSVQGARRLQSAIDAIADESLRRAGTSVRELQTGFSATSVSAINDVDQLSASIDKLGLKGADAGRALAGALDKAGQTANTERAVQAVIDRWELLGKQGVVTGDQLAAGLEKARQKLDQLKPGISSLDEALRSFGLKTRTELQATADKLGAAYAQITNSVTVSLTDKIRAFTQYREAAIAANAGVESSEIALQRRILEAQAAAAGLGDTIVSAMGRAAGATNSAADAQARYNALLRADPTRLVGGDGIVGIGDPRITGVRSAGGADNVVTGQTREQRLAGQGGPVDNSLPFILRDKLAAGTLTDADLPGAQAALRVARDNASLASGSSVSLGGLADMSQWVLVLQQIVDKLSSGGLGDGARKVPARAQPQPGRIVNITVNNRTTPVNVATEADQDALTDVLQQLGEAGSRTTGP